jgi:(E)-4-hydroxy-3-methylbut-2-enyl-diphosphate synthase
MALTRRSTPTVKIDNISMGCKYPIVVQSMTNTLTSDIDATVSQILMLYKAGSEMVRITVNDSDAMAAVPEIKRRLLDLECHVPLIGDFHYNGHILLEKFPNGASALSKYRINPGNVGRGEKKDQNFETMIKCAINYNKPIRIGINGGSLDEELLSEMMEENASLSEPLSFKDVFINAMVLSATSNAQKAESLGLSKNKIVVSVKLSDLQDMIAAYQRLAAKCDYVLHLGLTEAGGGVKGISSSSAALAILLQQGIGDTIRISLTPEPGVPRDLEVKNCNYLLQSMGFRYFMPMVTSCPGCGRTNSDRFIHLAKDITTYIEKNMPSWKQKFSGVEKLKVAVMGCVVNGPGESKFADIGISFPGNSEKPSIPIYQDGKLLKLLDGDSKTVKEDFIDILMNYISHKYTS